MASKISRLLSFVAGLVIISGVCAAQLYGPIRVNTRYGTTVTQSGFTNFFADKVLDGNTSTTAWMTDHIFSGSWIQVALAHPVAVVQVRLYADAAGSDASYSVQFSEDGLAWQNATSGFVAGAQGWNSAGWRNVGQHRYWRVMLDNDPSPGPSITELELDAGQRVELTPAMLSQQGLTAYYPEGIADKDVATYGWQTDQSAPGAWLKVDLGQGRKIIAVSVYGDGNCGNNPDCVGYWLDNSDDDITYENVDASLFAPGWTTFQVTPRGFSGEWGAHRYWRLRLGLTRTVGPWLSELVLFDDGTSYREVPLSPSMFSESGLSAYDPSAIANGDTADYAWHTDSYTGGASPYLQVDLGVPQSVVQAGVYSALGCCLYGLMDPRYKVTYSDDASTWSEVYSYNFQGGLDAWYKGWNTFSWGYIGAHRYWRFTYINPPGWWGPWLSELRLLAIDQPQSMAQVVVTQSGLNGFVAGGVTDGDISTVGWHTDAAVVGSWLQLDIGTAAPITGINLYAWNAGLAASYTIQYSDDTTTWSEARTGFVPSAIGWNHASWDNAGDHRYWRLLLENAPGAGSWITEVQLVR